jgi:hypothetical protein
MINPFVTRDRFPAQSEQLGARCVVAFNGDLANLIADEIHATTVEEPCRTIVLLDDDRTVLGSECAYTVVALF